MTRRQLLALVLLIPAHAVAAPKAAPAAPPPAPVQPFTTAKSVIIIDAMTGKALYEKNADEKRAVASTQKLLAALILCESGNLDRLVTVADYDTQAEPTKLFLKTGQQYKRRELMKGLLVKSANDAARCLARNHAGSEADFAKLMNKRAAMLGMTSSQFKCASGLPMPDQYSTARDMSRLARAAWNQPVIRSLVGQKKVDFTYADGRVKTLDNTNRVLTDSPYCNGMKTGYTSASGKCLISSGTHRGRTVIIVMLGGESPKTVWKETKGLLHWALGVP